MQARMEDKQEQLFARLRNLERVIVAFSGGTDSAYLAWAANRELGKNALAVTADSASIPESHKRDAEAFVERFGIAHEYIQTREFDNPDYARNGPDRCFHCKDELFTRLEELGRERGYRHIIYGVNLDDLGDYRPGQGAATNHKVAAPLADAGLSKAEIRELSRRAGLPTWDRPASACLSSRIPYGTPVTIENVKTVETGEEELKALGFRQFRVRFHGEVVRIEIAREGANALSELFGRHGVLVHHPAEQLFVERDARRDHRRVPVHRRRAGAHRPVGGRGGSAHCVRRQRSTVVGRPRPGGVLRLPRARPHP